MDDGRTVAFPTRQERHAAEFDEIFSEHRRKVFSLALRMTGNEEDAADILQETFIRVYKGLGDFRGDSSVSTWIYSIAANVCRTFFQKLKSVPVPMDPDAHPDAADPAAEFARGVEDRAFLENALAQVPHEIRMCVLLSDLIGFSYEEISQSLSIPVGTVKSRIFRGRKALIAILEPRRAERRAEITVGESGTELEESRS